jgi:uncharacterized membrane protein SirB2
LDYLDLRLLHMGLALISLSGFVLRWTWMMNRSRLYRHRLNSILPHFVDSVFLASAVGLAFTIDQYPFIHPWLTAKVLGLFAYIVLGSVALKRAATRSGKVIAFLAAIGVFAWVISVARLKSAWGFLGLAA